MFKNFRNVYLVAVLAASVVAIGFYCSNLPTTEISPAEFKLILTKGQITKATLTATPFSDVYLVEGTRRDRQGLADFKTTARLEDDQLRSLLAKSGIALEIPGRGFKSQFFALLPSLLVGGIVIALLVHQTSFGGSKRTQRIKERPSIRFADVAGVEEAKSEVREIVDFLKNPKKYRRLGGVLPKGVLLIGPPGTGKTMLAKAIAGEAEANFFSAHGSDFNEIFVGVGAKRIREIFKQAAKAKPAIIFIDEIDCLGKKRKADGHGELQQTNNALLAAMDGFEPSEGIVVIAATNRPEDLDEALTRPGRFDRKVHVPLPDMKGRRAILQAHCLKKPIENKDKTLDILAQTTSEMSGADIASMLNEAAILCAQTAGSEITLAQLEESRDKVRWGKERKSMVLRREEREMVAYHEAGHTIININKALLPPLYKVSIIPRGAALGVTTLLPTEDQNIHSKTFLQEQLVVLMGGRAAEKVFYGATTNGASGDLQSAKSIARSMIHEWGMGEKLFYEPEHNDAEGEINRILETADREAYDMIHREKDRTHKLAQALLKFDTLTREEVMALLYEDRLPVSETKVALN